MRGNRKIKIWKNKLEQNKKTLLSQNEKKKMLKMRKT